MTTDSTADYQSLRERIEQLQTENEQLGAHLDAIIAAYQTSNALGPLINACRAAKEWRGVNAKPKTAQDASGATQSP